VASSWGIVADTELGRRIIRELTETVGFAMGHAGAGPDDANRVAGQKSVLTTGT
jgi:hypothetical protein